jgi:hypothetical protein
MCKSEKDQSDADAKELLIKKNEFRLELQKREEDCIQSLEIQAAGQAKNLIAISGLSGIFSITRVSTDNAQEHVFILVALVFLTISAGIGCIDLSKGKSYKIIDLASLNRMIYKANGYDGGKDSLDNYYFQVFSRIDTQLSAREKENNKRFTFIHWGYVAYSLSLAVFVLSYFYQHVMIV